MVGGFRFLEHIGDVYVEAFGESLEEAFAQAALALYNTISSTDNVRCRITKSIELSGEDLEALLVEWLQNLIAIFDIENFIAKVVDVKSIEKVYDGYILRAQLCGEEFNPEYHRIGVHVKAATYWRMEIITKDREVVIRFLLDI
ncbi:MAG: archease [Aigarchaeota archaeon]|nr:archease [Aigarchaeota archaeon]MCX8193420.1 archease [Nitrososphaeria archaeon]MDW7985848.1 archease [Nitrososphaerota archaeon]